MNLFEKINKEDAKSDFTTFPLSFKNYKWYKPILIFIIGLVLFLIIVGCLYTFFLFCDIMNIESIKALSSGSIKGFDEVLGLLIIFLFVPAIYIPSKLLHERPFSSYLTSVGEWNWKIFIKTFVISLIIYAIFNLCEIIITGETITFNNSILIIILMLIFIPLQCFGEEFLFRGFLMQTFGSWFRIPILAIILQAIIFTVCHEYSIIGLVDIFISGLVYGFVAWRTKGLEFSTALHVANNLIVFVVLGFGTVEQSTEIPLESAVISLIMLFATVGIIYLIDKKFNFIGLNKSKNLNDE